MIRTIAETRALGRARVALTTRAVDWRRDGARARLAVARTLSLEERSFARGEQVHGGRVATLDGSEGEVTIPGVDGLATRSPLVLVALGADCPGVALLGEDAVAVVHSGWRGTVADVGPNAVRALAALGARPVEAWIGPGIGPCCFEVGDEVVAAIEAAHGPLGPLVSRPRGTKAHVDLKGAIARRLRGAGVERVHVSPECTRCARERFFSRRGEGEGCGHHALLAWLA